MKNKTLPVVTVCLLLLAAACVPPRRSRPPRPPRPRLQMDIVTFPALSYYGFAVGEVFYLV